MTFQPLTLDDLVDSLTYISYATQRDLAPHITPETWAKYFDNAEAMEARYQREPKEGA